MRNMIKIDGIAFVHSLQFTQEGREKERYWRRISASNKLLATGEEYIPSVTPLESLTGQSMILKSANERSIWRAREGKRSERERERERRGREKIRITIFAVLGNEQQRKNTCTPSHTRTCRIQNKIKICKPSRERVKNNHFEYFFQMILTPVIRPLSQPSMSCFLSLAKADHPSTEHRGEKYALTSCSQAPSPILTQFIFNLSFVQTR